MHKTGPGPLRWVDAGAADRSLSSEGTEHSQHGVLWTPGAVGRGGTGAAYVVGGRDRIGTCLKEYHVRTPLCA